MTAGHGVAHSEEGTGRYRGKLHGVQLWVAQSSATRDGPAAFEHHADLPVDDLDNAVATVLLGDLNGLASPARHDTDHVGIDLDLRTGTTIVPLRADLEHALIAFTNASPSTTRPSSPATSPTWARPATRSHCQSPSRLGCSCSAASPSTNPS